MTTPPKKVENDPAWFADATDDLGLKFVHDCGPTGNYFMPQLTGGGAAFLDFDNDGRLDIYFVQNGGPDSRSTNGLFRQTADGRFEDVSSGSGLNVAGYCQGAAVGDVNNDGWSDVLVTEFGRGGQSIGTQHICRFGTSKPRTERCGDGSQFRIAGETGLTSCRDHAD